MKKRWLLFLLVFIIPWYVKASTILVSEDRKPIVGSTFIINASVDYGSNKLMTAHYILTYDPDCFSLASTSWPQGAVSLRNELGSIYIDKEATTPAWEPGAFVILSFRVNKVCTKPFEIKENGAATNQQGKVVKQSFAALTISTEESDNNSQLESLGIKDQNLNSFFSKSENNYTANVSAEVSTIEIIAVKGNSKQKITSNGTVEADESDKNKVHIHYDLLAGLNKINIKVTAENGSSNTYVLKVTRENNESTEADLKRLSVSNTNIKYMEGKDVYEAKVNTSIENVFITAATVDPKAELTGTGTKKIIEGENVFTIKVKSSSGKEKQYTIKIIKSNDVGNNVGVNTIKSLRINGENIDKIEKNTLISVDETITSLQLDIELESETAVFSVEGNKNFKNGLNTVIITVSDDNTDSNLYYIRVYKNYDNYVVVNNLNELTSLPTSIIVNKPLKDNHVIDQSIVALARRSNKSVLYNVVNEKNGVLYQVLLNSNLENKDEIDATITKEKDNPLVYSSKIREGVKVTLFLDTEEFSDSEIIKIYSYNEEGAYKLVNSNTSISNGYVEFQTNGDKYYVFTKQSLIKEEDKTIKLLKQFKDYIIFGIAFVVIIIFLLIISKLRKKKVVENK